MGTDLPGDLATKARRIVDFTVGPSEEDDLVDADRLGGGELLRLPSRSNVGGACRNLGRPLVTGGYDHERGLAAGANEARDGTGAVRLHVIRVGNDHEDTPKGLQFGIVGSG